MGSLAWIWKKKDEGIKEVQMMNVSKGFLTKRVWNYMNYFDMKLTPVLPR